MQNVVEIYHHMDSNKQQVANDNKKSTREKALDVVKKPEDMTTNRFSFSQKEPTSGKEAGKARSEGRLEASGSLPSVSLEGGQLSGRGSERPHSSQK